MPDTAQVLSRYDTEHVAGADHPGRQLHIAYFSYLPACWAATEPSNWLT